MKKLLGFLGILILSLGILPTTVVAKGFTQALEKYSPQQYALIYGCIDTSSIDAYISLINMRIYPYKNFKIYPGARFNDAKEDWINPKKGYFWVFVKPGQYFFSEFETQKIHPNFFSGNGRTVHDMYPKHDAEIKSRLIIVSAGDLYYWGSFKYVKTQKSRLFSRGKFDLTPIYTPSKRDILEELVKDARGTKWEHIIINK